MQKKIDFWKKVLQKLFLSMPTRINVSLIYTMLIFSRVSYSKLYWVAKK